MILGNDWTCGEWKDYCYQRLGDGGPIFDERFEGLSVRGYPALVVHSANPHHEFWHVVWYAAAENLSYSIDLQNGVARRLGANGFGPHNVTLARDLTAE